MITMQAAAIALFATTAQTIVDRRCGDHHSCGRRDLDRPAKSDQEIAGSLWP
jgi:hypothetical protein